MDKRIFEKENRIFKYYINNTTQDENTVDFIQALFKLELINADKTEKQDIVQLFNIVGFDKFFELVSYFGSRPIKLPKAERVKKLLILSITYYYVVVLRIPPKQVGKILSEKLGVFNLKQKSIKSLVNKLQQELDTLYTTALNSQMRRACESQE